MNENSDGTPNPLNSNQGGQTDSNVVDSFIRSTPLDANPAEPIQPVEEVEEAVVEKVVESTPTETKVDDPLSRPMQKAPTEDETVKPKKKNVGLIIGIIVSLLAAAGLGTAAAIIALQNQGDPVTKAFSKLINGELPANIAVDGTIEIVPNTTGSQITSLKIDLDSKAATSSPINTTKATITTSVKGGDDFSFTFDEVYAANGDLYFKLDGIKNIIENTDVIGSIINGDQNVINATSCDSEECVEATTVTSTDTDETLAVLLGVGQLIDGEWLRISTSELTSISEGAADDSDLSCLVDLVGDASKNSNSLTEFYSKNPFIYSSSDNITIASKQNPIYEVGINSEKFTNFMNTVQGSGLLQDFYNCLGYEYAEVNIDNIVADIEELPVLYVEVDKDYNFTRLYFVSDINDSAANIITDLDFSYPTNINVSEPVEYKDFSKMIEEIFSSMYELPE